MHTDAHRCTQMHTDAHRCTPQMHTTDAHHRWGHTTDGVTQMGSGLTFDILYFLLCQM